MLPPAGGAMMLRMVTGCWRREARGAGGEMLAAGTEAGATGSVPVREADAVCGACHREILESYLKTPMANASGLATDRLHVGTYQDLPSGMRYAVSGSAADGATAALCENGGLSKAGASQTAGAGATQGTFQGSERLEYFLGSGHIGLTYVYEKNGYWLESPVAFYEKLQGYAMKPGAEGMRTHATGAAARTRAVCAAT